jgi:heme/copper-type cytochrome/quinol oxidase subunit 4
VDVIYWILGYIVGVIITIIVLTVAYRNDWDENAQAGVVILGAVWPIAVPIAFSFWVLIGVTILVRKLMGLQ